MYWCAKGRSQLSRLNLAADGAEVIDASHMIVMPGLIDFALSHVEHNWPQFHFRRWFRVFSGEVGDVGAITMRRIFTIA